MEELISSLQRAAQMLDALRDKPVWSQYGSGLEMARFIRSLLPKMMDGSLSSAEKLELWHIFAPTCAWDDTVGHVELGDRIFALIEAAFPACRATQPNIMKCALCERDVAALTTHHLVPRARLKQGDAMPTIEICPACHRQLHVLFGLEQLAQEYNTLERLRDEPRMKRFLKWVRRQDPNKRVRVRR